MTGKYKKGSYFQGEGKVYTVGLDPTYMSEFDGDLYREWVKITQGQVAVAI